MKIDRSDTTVNLRFKGGAFGVSSSSGNIDEGSEGSDDGSGLSIDGSEAVIRRSSDARELSSHNQANQQHRQYRIGYQQRISRVFAYQGMISLKKWPRGI